MTPKNRKPTHPGEILLEEFLIPMEITQMKLASHLGWSNAKINEIVKERRGITSKTALAFSDAFGTTPEFWLNLQRDFDLWISLQEHNHLQQIC